MEIDRTTLADLEIFSSPDGKGGLFDLIDHTATASGRSALRARVEQPSSDIASIRRTQNAVDFLQHHPGVITLHEAFIAPVVKYLRSNIAVDAASPFRERVEYAWMRFRYRDLLKEIGDGVKATATLFQQVDQMCEALEEKAPPPAISELLEPLAAISETVLRDHAEAETLLGQDRALRSTRKGAIEESLNLLGELDALNSMAAATSAYDWVLPEVIESDTFVLEAKGVYHPFVDEPVTNPVRLSGGEPMVFLTGPNMAGKTTYLRSVAVTVHLAHVGMGVPASQVRVSPVEAVFTSLNPSDNLRAGVSYYLAEVMRVKAAAALLAEGRRALVIFDEVFKGTNVRDALDASAEVILGFAKARRSGFIFSSHLAELVEFLRSNPAIRFCCFDGDIQDGTPQYSYELRDGVSDKRFGLLLLRQAEVPELIARISA